MQTNDIMYNIMLHSDSISLQNLVVNKIAKSIFYNPHFWKELFIQRHISTTIYTFEELERYEKCQSIVKNIILLANQQSIFMSFDDENIIQYLPSEMINEIKTSIDEDEIIDQVPTAILKQLSIDQVNNIKYYNQYVYFSFIDDYDHYRPQVAYSLSTHDEVIDVIVPYDVQTILTKLVFSFPTIDVHDGDFTYLPTILTKYCDVQRKSLRPVIQKRIKFWKSKQWFL